MMRAAFVMLGAMSLSACFPDPTTTPARSTPPAASVAAASSEHCELVNGPRGCAEDAGREASPQPAAPSNREQASAQFEPWMCEQGASAVGPVWGAVLTGNLKNLQNYCLEVEGGAGATASSGPSTATTPAAGEARAGTWYCEDRVDGSGNYGTWEMTQFPDRYYNCKRVD